MNNSASKSKTASKQSNVQPTKILGNANGSAQKKEQAKVQTPGQKTASAVKNSINESSFVEKSQVEISQNMSESEPKKRGKCQTQSNYLFIGRRKSEQNDQGKTEEGGAKRATKKTMKLRDSNSFQTYIFRVLKEVKPELSISKSTMTLVNSILADLFEKVLKEARNLMIFSKRSTLSSKEIESAVKLLFPGELQKLAVQTGRSTLQKLQASANQ